MQRPKPPTTEKRRLAIAAKKAAEVLAYYRSQNNFPPPKKRASTAARRYKDTDVTPGASYTVYGEYGNTTYTGARLAEYLHKEAAKEAKIEKARARALENPVRAKDPEAQHLDKGKQVSK